MEEVFRLFVMKTHTLLQDQPAVGVMVCVSIGLTAEAVFKLGRIMAMTRKRKRVGGTGNL